MNANKTVDMPPRRIAVRPMDDRFGSVAVVDHLAANLDSVARMNRDARCEPDVIDDLDGARCSARIERLVLALRFRAEEEVGCVEDASGERDFAAAVGVIRCSYRNHRVPSVATFTHGRCADKGYLRCE